MAEQTQSLDKLLAGSISLYLKRKLTSSLKDGGQEERLIFYHLSLRSYFPNLNLSRQLMKSILYMWTKGKMQECTVEEWDCPFWKLLAVRSA